MIDEQLMRYALSKAAVGFEVPEDGFQKLLDAIHKPIGLNDQTGLEATASLEAGGTPTGGVKKVHTTRKAVYKRKPILLGATAALLAIIALAFTAVPTFLAVKPSNPTTALPSSRSGAPFPSRASHINAAMSAPAGQPNQSTLTTTPISQIVGQPAKIEQTGSLGLTVGKGNLNSTMVKLTSLALGNGGFISTSQTTNIPGEAPSGSLTLQVPVDSFDAVLKQATTFGRVDMLTTNATDVTAKYVDLQAQISALDASRQQYLTIMSQATNISDILAVQSQIDSIQSQIDQLQGQLNVLKSETTYSTLSVSIVESGYPGPHPPMPPRPESGIVKAFHKAVAGFVNGFEGLLSASGGILFVILVIAALIVIVRFAWRGARRLMI
jgi:hypothetical protein